jgi:TPR repeat protein
MQDEISAEELFRLAQGYLSSEKNDLALRYLELAANSGHDEAQFELSNELSMNAQHELSYEWLIEASDNGYGPATRVLIMHHEYPADELDIESVVSWYKNPENSCRGDRTFELAEFLFYCQRKEEGLDELKRAASLDNAAACSKLSVLYLNNRIPQSEPNEGLAWLIKAADLGYGWAAEKLSELYLKGGRSKFFPDLEVTTDKVRAIAILERNVSWGWNTSAYTLALIYLEGIWIDADYTLAEKWLLEAANNNVSFAQTKLADEYMSGKNFPYRIFEAAHWYRRAANRDTNAAFNLCMLLASDQLGPANFKECSTWFSYLLNRDPLNVERAKGLLDLLSDGRFSEDQTDSFSVVAKERFLKQLDIVNNCVDKSELGSSAYKLSKFYLHGLGTSADQTHHHYWLKKSAEQGLYAAKVQFENMSTG